MTEFDDDGNSRVLGRRQILRGAASVAAMGALFGRWPALARPQASGFGGGEADEEFDVSDLLDDASMQSVCSLTPAQIQGPYYANLNLVRQDIAEGKPGLRTKLWISVVRTSDCSPVPNATVDVWHADAQGVYSAFASQGTAGQTYLRGVQFTDAIGMASFDTIFPGWYPGRTPHIHLKARPVGGAALTTQMYFLQALANRIYARTPYSAHGQADTTNAGDGFFDVQTRMSVLGYMQGVLHLEFTVGVP